LILLRAAANRSAIKANIKIKRFHSPRGERVHFFCWPKRNGTKEKGQPRSQRHGALFVPGFFDSPSWLGRKTPHIHVRRPRVCGLHGGDPESGKQSGKRKAKSEKRKAKSEKRKAKSEKRKAKSEKRIDASSTSSRIR